MNANLTQYPLIFCTHAIAIIRHIKHNCQHKYAITREREKIQLFVHPRDI